MFNNYTEFVNNNQTGNSTDIEEPYRGGGLFGLAIILFFLCFFLRFIIKGDCNESNDDAVQRAKNRIAEKDASRSGMAIL